MIKKILVVVAAMAVCFSATADELKDQLTAIIDPNGVLDSIEFADVGTWSLYDPYGTTKYARWQMGSENQGSRVDVLTARFTTERDAAISIQQNAGYGFQVQVDGASASSQYVSGSYQYAVTNAGDHVLTVYFGNAYSSYYTTIGAINIQESPDSFDVTFDARGGSCNVTNRTYSYGASYGTLPVPTLAGCTFLGWSTQQSGSEYVTSVDSPSFTTPTLYARWQLNNVAQFLGEGSGITFTTLTNQNWSLQCQTESEWDYQQQRSVNYCRPYLSWSSSSYIQGGVETIIFEGLMEGAGILRIPTTLYGNMNVVLTIDGVAETNYYVSGSGSYGEPRRYVGRYYGNQVPTTYTRIFLTSGRHYVKLSLNATADSGSMYSYQAGNVQIGAMSWEASSSSAQVTFDANGGSIAGNAAREYFVGSTYSSLPTPTRSGCQFLGWYSSKFGGKRYVDSDYVDWTAKTLYAHWISTIENTLGESVSNVNVGSPKIYADGSGIILPLEESDYGEPYNSNNWFEVTCDGEAIVSFDWTFDGVSHSSNDYFAEVMPEFSVDGESLRTQYHDKYLMISSYDYFGGNNIRKTIRVFLPPGAHTLRWAAGMLLCGADMQIRLAVENFKIEEKPVANRETLFDWGKLAYDYLVWKPNNLSLIQDRYSQRIGQNPNDYEARIWRALTKIVRLGENDKARKVIGQFGYAISDYTLKPQGAFVGFEHAPLPNAVVDAVIPEIISAIDSALEDVCAIPTDWSGRIEINPDDYGCAIKTNSVWTDEKVYFGLAEVSAMRATLEAARAFVKLAQGYDYEADYLSVSNAWGGVRSGVYEWLSDVMAVAPKAGLVRNLSAMMEAKENFRAALESVKRADAAILNRGDYNTYVFEYDIADAEDIGECRKILNQVEASLDATNVIDLTYFTDKYDTNGLARAGIPGGEAIGQLFLGALFAGKVTRELAPEAFINNEHGGLWPHMQSIPDPTLGGILPEFTLNDIAQLYSGNQKWEMSAYLAYNPQVKLKAGKSLIVYCTAERDAELSYSSAVPGFIYSLSDWSESLAGDTVTDEGVSRTIDAKKGTEYEIFFEPYEDMKTPEQPIVVTAAPMPLADGGPYTETVNGVEITFEVVDGEAWIGTSEEDQGVPEDTAGVVTIPETLGGRKVVGINGYAFFRCKGITQLVFMGDEPMVLKNAFSKAAIGDVLVTRAANWSTTVPGTWNGFSIAYVPSYNSEIVVTADKAAKTKFSIATTLTLSSECGQMIHFTTDGTSPTVDSPVYTAPLDISETVTVKFFAVDQYNDWGPISSVTLTRVASETDSILVTPSVADGTRFVGSQNVTLDAGSGKVIYYTTDGSDPKMSNTRQMYVGPICMSASTILKYFAVDNTYGDWSAVKTACYTLRLPDGTASVENANGYDWPFYIVNGEAIIGYNDNISHAEIDFEGKVRVPSMLGGCPVVEIGKEVFSGTAVADVCMPTSLRNVGDFAFFMCPNIKQIEFPSQVTNIGHLALSGCSSIENIRLPQVLTSLGVGAITGIGALREISVPENMPNYCVYDGVLYDKRSMTLVVCPAYKDSIEFMLGVICVGRSSFARSKIQSLDIPETVEKISASAFYECQELKWMSIPPGVEFETDDWSMGYCTFQGCTSLSALHFKGNAPLELDAKSFVFGIDMPEIGYVPANSNLTIYVHQGSTGWGCEIPGLWEGRRIKYVDTGTVGDWGYKYLGNEKIEVELAEGVMRNSLCGVLTVPSALEGMKVNSIGIGSFMGATHISEVVLPDEIDSIGGSAFRDCMRLQSVNLPDGLTSIGDNAFRECTSLTDITIPASVTNIGYFAFRDCLRLTNVTLLGEAPRQDLGVYMGVPAFTTISGRIGSATAIVYAGITNKTEDITVPENWLDELAIAHDKPAGADSYQAAFKAKYGDDLKAALTKPTGKHDLKGNPLYVWQDYVAGTDPLDEEDKFTATITMENGVPVVRWDPELATAAAALRKYTVYGATALDGKWDDVSDKTDKQRYDLGYQFFSVTVEMK